jgi:plasmid stability protein
MTTITIRNVPDEVRNTLAARAALSGRSMQEYVLRQLIRLASARPRDVVLAEIRRNARTMPPLDIDSLLADIAADKR